MPKENIKINLIRMAGIFLLIIIIIMLWMILPYWASEIITPLSDQEVGGILFYTMLMVLIISELSGWIYKSVKMVFNPQGFVK